MNGSEIEKILPEHFRWNWTDFCPTGIRPWQNNTNDLLPCFQEIILQLPIYVIFAVISSFYCGSYNFPVSRNAVQLKAIHTRIVISIGLAIIPVAKLLYFLIHHLDLNLNAIDVLLTCTKTITWIVHVGYLLMLRRYGEISHRGPLIINVFWTAIFVLDAIWLQTSFSYQNVWPWSLASFILSLCYLGTFLSNGFAVQVRPVLVRDGENQSLLTNQYVQFDVGMHEVSLGHAQDEANYASKLLFYWVEPLITKGVIGNLKRVEDLFELPDCLNINRNFEKLQTAIFRSNSLLWALHKAFGKEFYLIGILKLLADVAGFAGPLLLGGLLSEHTKNEMDASKGSSDTAYLYALGLLLFTLFGALCTVHFNWRVSVLGMKMRTGIVTTIYSKAVEARNLDSASPEVLNLMSIDADRVVNSCISFHSFWSIPFQLFTTLYLLYTQVGAAFIAGVIFAAALIPINRLLATKIQQYSVGFMSAKDSRLSAASETFHSAKHIKLHAWEDIFIEKIRKLRKEEMKFLQKNKYLDAVCVYFWATTPILMCLLTFGVSVLMGNPLTAATTYTSVALLNMLIGPLNAFPWVLNGLIEAWVSVKRVQQLFDLPNLDLSTYYEPIFQNKSKPDEKNRVLEIKDANFEYEITENSESDFRFKLEGINLQVKQGDLVCIEGPVGGGKTSLMSAIIAKIKCTKGTVALYDLSAGFGYVSQTPWLQRGTIRENITWGCPFDEQKYKKIIYCCALIEDIIALGGDQIGIGENGHSLSGGQRMRLALARAIYQDKNIYLFDDILSCVDAHVANHIITNCLLGYLKSKTRIIISENSTLCLHANQILRMEDGVLKKSPLMSDSFELSDEDENYDEWGYSSRMSSIDLDHIEEDKKSVDSIMLEESKEGGYIKWHVLSVYLKAMKSSLAFSVVSFVALMQVSRNLSDVWLAKWVTETNSIPNNSTNVSLVDSIDVDNFPVDYITAAKHSLSYYLGIYTAFAVVNSMFTLVRAFIFAYAGLRAARFIHDKLLNQVLYTKFYFFDITSVGRILNRFSSDTYTIDDTLPFILNIFLAMTGALAGSIIVTLYAMPWLGLIIVPMIPVYINIQYRYRYAARDIKRLSSNALSPLYSHFTETLEGLTTIRAMRASIRFQRDFHVKLEESIKAQLTSSAASQWLTLRLNLLGSFLVGGAGLLAALTSAHYAYPSLVGLAISYALTFTGLLSGVLSAFAETEQEFVAVERVSQYLDLENEENYNGTIDPPFGWPTQGAIEFKNVYFKYRDHLTPALVNFNLKTEAFERIAIVGRTGAGKSSILSSLFRVAPLAHGEIILDCVNLKTLALNVLRDRISIIPQQPFLFEGTVRENLDPRKNYLDSELWNAITACLATPLVQSLGGLDGYLEKGGNNLSAGQKQLLCLTRALLKNAQVICIDEGTSNLDADSEAAIQIALKNSFRSSTVILIAHRLKGLQNVDRIIVMENGNIVEEGLPRQLASNPESIFSKMLLEQKNTDYTLCDSS